MIVRSATTATGGVVAVVVGALAVAVSTPPIEASAHELPAGVVTTVDEISPPVAGLVVQAVQSVTTQLVMENGTGRPVAVLDDEGQPFLRLLDGRVEADVASVAWHRSNDPFGTARLPDGAGGGEPGGSWQVVAESRSWGWFDHRLHPAAVTPPSTAAAGEPRVLARWTVPLDVGGQAVEVRGVVEVRPPAGAYRIELTGRPAVPAVVVEGPAPALLLHGRDGVTVLGARGEPMLRFDPAGTHANAASPTWHDVARAMAAVADPEVTADPAAAPVWTQVSDATTFTWIDPRLRLPSAPPDDPGTAAVAGRWRVPVVVGGTDTALEGAIRWVPAADGGGRGASGIARTIVVAGLAAVTGLLAGLLGRDHRRRRRLAE